jgi:hypothetical protein
MPNSPKTDLREAKIGREKTPIEPVWRRFGARFGYKVNDIPCRLFALLPVQKQRVPGSIWVAKTVFGRRFGNALGRVWVQKLTIFGAAVLPASGAAPKKMDFESNMSGCKADYCEVGILALARRMVGADAIRQIRQIP